MYVSVDEITTHGYLSAIAQPKLSLNNGRIYGNTQRGAMSGRNVQFVAFAAFCKMYYMHKNSNNDRISMNNHLFNKDI